MKKFTLIYVLSLLSIGLIHAQEAAIFKLNLRSDTILMGNYFEIKFSLKNAAGSNFSPPSFEEFDVVGGPNQSSSLSIVNGVTNQQMGYSFYLQPKDIGNYYIEAASIEANGEILETQPVEIIVLPNPDGEKADYSLNESQSFDLWGGSRKDIEKNDSLPKEQKKKKKKRKIYRL